LNLPRPIYENLPFLYFGISGYLLVFFNDWQLLLPAVIFYCAACIILVARSANRRRDQLKKLNQSYSMPTIFYEYMPYLYIAVAVFILLVAKMPILQFVSFVLMVIAFRNLVCRHNNRMSKRSKF
jgi:membrane protein implicated in regulation of membrane protease activity